MIVDIIICKQVSAQTWESKDDGTCKLLWLAVNIPGEGQIRFEFDPITNEIVSSDIHSDVIYPKIYKGEKGSAVPTFMGGEGEKMFDREGAKTQEEVEKLNKNVMSYVNWLTVVSGIMYAPYFP